MLQITLPVLESVLKSNDIDDEKVKIFCDMLLHYRPGQWIYPGAFKRKTHISIEKIYIIFDELEKRNVLESYFEVNCGECKKMLGEVYKTLIEIPEEIYCDNCKKYIATKKNTYLIYKVL